MEFITQEILPFVKNHPMLSIGWIGLLVAIIVMTIKSKLSKVVLISNSQAVNMINKSGAVFIDLRSADGFKKGHITDAYNILPVDIKNGSIKAIEKHKDSPVILADENGMTVSTAGNNLVSLGFSQVFALKDGISGWSADNLPLVKK